MAGRARCGTLSVRGSGAAIVQCFRGLLYMCAKVAVSKLKSKEEVRTQGSQDGRRNRKFNGAFEQKVTGDGSCSGSLSNQIGMRCKRLMPSLTLWAKSFTLWSYSFPGVPAAAY